MYLNYINIKYDYAKLKMKGGSNIKIISELGKGMLGIVYLISMNGKKYAMKKQKVQNKNPKEFLRELIFYEWINKLSIDQQKFFMRLHYHKTYKCDFGFVSINKKVNSMIKDYKYCNDFVLDLKDGNINDLLNLNKFTITYIKILK